MVVVLGPGGAFAQTPASQAGAPATGQTRADRKTPLPPGTPLEHLAKARAALDAIAATGFSPEAATRLSEMKTRFAEMEKSYKEMGVTKAAAQERETGTRFTIKKTGTWSTYIGDIDRLAGELLGFPLANGSRIQLAEPSKGQVQTFRTHLTHFALAADGTAGANQK
jgi:hypothetical protein